MKKLITTVTVAALLAVGAAAPALAGGGQRHHGIWPGTAYHAGSTFKHRSTYRYRDRRHFGFWRPYSYWPSRHYGHRYGGSFYFRGDGAVIVGALAGAVVLGALLSRPAPARAPVLRSPTGAALGGCLRTTGNGTWYGRPAQFSGTMCYDPAGRAYVLPGSERFIGYLR